MCNIAYSEPDGLSFAPLGPPSNPSNEGSDALLTALHVQVKFQPTYPWRQQSCHKARERNPERHLSMNLEENN